jgi:hypothetical protein
MLAELRPGLALWVGLIGQNGIRIPESATPLVFGACVVVLLLSVFLAQGWLRYRLILRIILAASILVVAAMDLPQVVGVTVILAISLGLTLYFFWRHFMRN